MRKMTMLCGLTAVLVVALMTAAPPPVGLNASAAEPATADPVATGTMNAPMATGLTATSTAAELVATNSADEPVQIATYDQLRTFIKQENAGTIPADTNALLVADIVVPESVGNDWVPLAKKATRAYSGTFDGAGHTISGIAIDRTYPNPYKKGTHVEDHTAFISFLGAKGTVKNLNLKASIHDVNFASGLVSHNEGTIEGCTFKGSLRNDVYPHGAIDDSDGAVGGIAGQNLGTIRNCKALPGTRIQRGGVNAGGIVGRQENGATVSGCESGANVRIRKTAYKTMAVFAGSGGGIVGSQDLGAATAADPRPVIENCVNRGKVNGEQGMGGICGSSIGGIILNCTNGGNIDGAKRGRSGGICGEFIADEKYAAELRKCTNSGAVNRNTGNKGSYLGGIVGSAEDFLPYYVGGSPCPVKITACKNTGSVTGENGIGGIAGGVGSCYYDDNPNEHVYIHGLMNLGSIRGVNAVGGIVGSCPGIFADAINYGRVKAVQGSTDEYDYCTIGGIVGDCGSTGGISTSYNLGRVSVGSVKKRPVLAGGITGNSASKLPGCYYSMENSGDVTCGNGAAPSKMGSALSLSQMAGANAKKYMRKLLNGQTSYCAKTKWHICANVEQGKAILAMTPQFKGLSANVAEIKAAGVDPSIPATVSFLDKAKVKPRKAMFTYTGKAIVPKVTVTLDRTNSAQSTQGAGSGTELVKGTDYVVYTCIDNVECGKATLWVLGKGKYAGKAKCSFTIKPAKARVQSTTVGNGSVTVKMQKGPAAYGGSSFEVQYRAKGSSKWASKTSTKRIVKISNLKTGKAYQVRVRAIAKTHGKILRGAWSKVVSSEPVPPAH